MKTTPEGERSPTLQWRPENCGNTEQATVAAFRPWRSLQANIPQPLAGRFYMGIVADQPVSGFVTGRGLKARIS